MALERTFAIIKPDAFSKGWAGRIISRIESEGFRLVTVKRFSLTKKQAEGFYDVHRDKKFFGSLTDFMSSGPCIAMVLEAEDAIAKWRTLMGATNPEKAEANTLRADFGESIERNATHGSDATKTAAYEMSYFFNGIDLLD